MARVNAVIVSAAKETNGQNTRYAKASQKHGGKAEILRAFAIGRSDPAGVVARFQAAAEKSPDLRIRSASQPDLSYLQFPHDLVWGKDDQEIARLIDEADVIHLNNSDRAMKRFHIQAKPALIHHHGTTFRSDPDHFLQVARLRRMVTAVSTIDLLRHGPEGVLHWLPTAYPVSELQAFGQKHKRPDDGRVLIVHAPTPSVANSTKGTAPFLAAIDSLQADGLPVDLDLVEGVSNAECMERKARADILFDQLTWGYGCNAVEAWGMGIPVVSGSDLWTDMKMREMWGDVPYALASEKTIRQVLHHLIVHKDARAEYAERGLNHVRKYHDEKPALAVLAELYADAIRHFVGKRPTMDKPARFMGPANRSFLKMWVLGGVIFGPDGMYETTNPDVARQLRNLSQRRSFGIEEVA